MIEMAGYDTQLIDAHLVGKIDESTRARIWTSAGSILAHGPLSDERDDKAIGLALGYIQSGKTTTITALIGAAADRGYRVIVTLLGSTNLLLDQNQRRILQALAIETRTDYRWRIEPNPKGKRGVSEVSGWLERGRVVLVPVLKHAGRIGDLASVLRSIDMSEYPVLIIDDEADQASLNTQAQAQAQSRTYEAISELRNASPRHLYVQFTATPYAPLLLQPDDHLLPAFVEFLHPGPGYIGGREFFIDHADKVVRPIPALDEQAQKHLPLELPRSLDLALGSFIAGAALLLANNPEAAPVSMLVHSTQRNDVQARYHFLLERKLRKWREAAHDAATTADLPQEIREERARLISIGAPDIPDNLFLEHVRHATAEATPWLVNSSSALKKVDWHVAPIHILVGGNKLDRGFTVEGLTVTYMNRPTSVQVDTMEQRARAFGYREDQLPYCQFFATPRTIKVLRDVVYTEYDLRATLEDRIEGGGTIEEWAREVGLLLPDGTKPTRDSVVQALSKGPTGWHSLRRPALDEVSRVHNQTLVRAIGLLDAPRVDYRRLAFRTVKQPLEDLLRELLEPWAIHSYSPGWRHEEILEALRRNPHPQRMASVILMDDGADGPRVRKWDCEIGFLNLFQGEDTKRIAGKSFYPGDRSIPAVEANPDDVVVQIHHVVRRDHADGYSLLTPAVYLGQRPIVRRNEATR